jgi:hypothetical protein
MHTQEFERNKIFIQFDCLLALREQDLSGHESYEVHAISSNAKPSSTPPRKQAKEFSLIVMLSRSR